ncbi:MAG: glycosyltransferase family 4 protein [Bryobacterales bacterium]|nr:glycosyltransferase family 4 protein [Bryobacterales bacterium]MBV9398236.1 glycosyltransferase family 4 protein [Bryobacterales bacterium]
MKILLVDQFGEIGGAQRCLLEAAAGFRDRGWELAAAVPAGSPLTAALARHCRRVHGILCGPFRSSTKRLDDGLRFAAQVPLQAAILARLVRREHVDVVYVNGPRLLPAACLARMGRAVIYHAHWMPSQQSASKIARVALNWSSASVIVPSRLAVQWLGSSVRRERTFTIYNGVASGVAEARRSESIAHIAVLGRISPEKGQLEFARAARIVCERIRGLRFTICGAPMFADREYVDQVRGCAQGAVQFQEWTQDAPKFLSGIDLLVVPSLNDHIPRVILEAFAAGVPVLAFPSGAIPELVVHGETGLLVKERTPEALAEAILAAVAKPDALSEMAARAHRLWRERYTLGRFQAEICDAVEVVYERRHRNPLKSARARAAA